MRQILIALSLGAMMSVAQAAPAPPDQVVKTAVERVQNLIHENHQKYRADLGAFYKVVDTEIVPLFDVRYIAQLVLGKNWKSASEEQRTHFAESFKNMLIRSYANAMLEYHDSIKAEWKPLRMAADATDVSVNSNLVREGKPPTPVGFSMHLAGDGEKQWKIYDITVESISLVTNFRGQIAAEIKNTGIDGVIKRMDSGQFTTKDKAADAVKDKDGK